MTSDGSPTNTAAPRRGVGPTGRRAGYLVAILVGAALLYGLNVWPGWEIVPFLTGATEEVLGLFNASLVVGIVVNVVNLVFDRVWIRAVGDLITLGIGIFVLVALWQVFPFAFPGGAIDWAFVVRILLALALLGSAVGLVVQLVTLIGAALRPAR